MPKCNQCGAELMDGAKFCPSCGAKVEQQPKVPTCPQCGQEINPSAAFCPNCGFNLRQGGQAPAPQPAPQPAPAPAPQPAPVQQQPRPVFQQQPYYQQQPMPQGYGQNAQKPSGPLPFVRTLIACIGIFLVYVLLILPLVLPMANGISYNYFYFLTQLFNFSYVTGFSVMYRIINLLVFLLPIVGFLSFGTIALVSGIQSMIRKEMPKYGVLGYAFGFYSVIFVLLFGNSAQTADYVGFSFPAFALSSPAYIMLFVAFILYAVIGVTVSFLNSAINKKPIAGPILKAVAAVIGIVLFVFIAGATICATNGVSYSFSPMYFYARGEYLMSSSSEYSSLGSFMLLHGIFYMMSVIYSGMAIGELFATNRRRAFRLSAIIFTGVSLALSILSVGFYYLANGSSDFISGMPSICGYIVLVLAIAFMVLANIGQNKEITVFRRPQQAPYAPRY